MSKYFFLSFLFIFTFNSFEQKKEIERIISLFTWSFCFFLSRLNNFCLFEIKKKEENAKKKDKRNYHLGYLPSNSLISVSSFEYICQVNNASSFHFI